MNIYLNIFLSVLDIAIATMIIYWFLKIIVKSEKMIFILNAIILFVILFFLGNLMHLKIVTSLLSSVFSWGIVLIFILFQNEIKGTLEKLGDTNVNIRGGQENSEDFISKITSAAFSMAKEKTGALITFELAIPLTKYTEKAIKINADYSTHLLNSIFNKESPIHDGAVVIKDERIMYASTYFPIELDINLDKKYGTRHRSAISISRETDSVTLIISEERGTVSIAYKEALYADLEYDFVIEYLRNKLK